MGIVINEPRDRESKVDGTRLPAAFVKRIFKIGEDEEV